MKEKVLHTLQEACPEVDFQANDALAESGILDSLLLVRIIAELTDEFDIAIPYQEIRKENFNSVDTIVAMVERLVKG